MNAHLYVEERPRPTSVSLSWDIAHHLYARSVPGRILVVVEDPVAFLSAVSKQWRRIVRQAQLARSSTLNATRKATLTQNLASMQKLRFTLKLEEGPRADVFFSTVAPLLDHPLECTTLYVTCPLEKSALEVLTNRMIPHGLVVIYS